MYAASAHTLLPLSGWRCWLLFQIPFYVPMVVRTRIEKASPHIARKTFGFRFIKIQLKLILQTHEKGDLTVGISGVCVSQA